MVDCERRSGAAYLRFRILGVYDLVLDVAAYGGVGVRDAEECGADEVGRVVDEVFCWGC